MKINKKEELEKAGKHLLKHPIPSINILITNAWYKWQKKTGHQSLPGTKIHGNVCVIQKVQDDAA